MWSSRTTLFFCVCCGFASEFVRCFVPLAGRSLLYTVDLLSSAGTRSMGGDRSAISDPYAHKHRHSDKVSKKASKEAHRRPSPFAVSSQQPATRLQIRCGPFIRSDRVRLLGGPTNQLLYRFRPTRLTPPFALLPTFCRTAARATGRGLSTAPALTTQPAG